MADKIQAAGKMRVFRGEGIASGVAAGRILVFDDAVHSSLPKVQIDPARVPAETVRLTKACEEAGREITELAAKVKKEIGASESSIFQAHLLILQDDRFRGEMLRVVEKDRLSAESAVRLVVESWEKAFSASSSQELQMKVYDLIDIGQRLLSKLSLAGPVRETERGIRIEKGRENVIIVTRLLLPSIAAFIDREKVLGIVTELGNRASHSAVIAKSLGLPAVFGVQNIGKSVADGEEVIVDGAAGIVYVDPDQAVRREFESFRKKYSVYMKKLENLTDKPSVTKDGCEMELYANVGALADVDLALRYRAKGVGLYRTEMPFLIRSEFPDEDLQYAIYKKVIDRMKGHPVSIRALDLGGDKMSSFFPMPKEENPNLGWRAIRVFIDHPQFFKLQLRAIFRAAHGADVRLILPMISDLTEVRITRKIIAEAKRELVKRGVPFNDNVSLGIMIEVPSAVLLAEHLIQEVDFFSVGTNDLIQYTLAIDRNSEKAARYFEPLNPAVLYMLKKLADVANGAGKSITVCGEVAGDPMYLPILVGMGYRKLSVNPMAINMLKDIVRNISCEESRKIAAQAMEKKTAQEVRGFMQEYLAGVRTQFSLAGDSIASGLKPPAP